MTAGVLPIGKLAPRLLADLLGGLGPPPPELVLGPAPGEDACVLRVPPGPLVAACDPLTMTGHRIGRHAVLVNANDVAVTGARPRWFLATVLLPPGTTEAALRELMAGMSAALAGIGAALVGGHTEVTPAVGRPVVAGTMLGVAEGGRFVSTGGARPGDVLVQVGPAPVEGAAVLARGAAERLRALDAVTLEAAAAAVDRPGISVVEPALVAAELGATALHDPTEGGLAAGLCELAAASGVRLVVDRSRLLWFEPGLAVCAALGADPWAVLASGALLATFGADAAGAALETLRRRGFAAAAVGTAEAGPGVVADTTGVAVAWPDRDEVSRLLG